MWKEGLFVLPQHLQLMESHHERLVDQRIASLIPHGWGVKELEIDEDALTRGLFQLKRCTAVMPDGLLVQIGPDHPTKAAMVMTAGKLVAGGQVTEIYLGVPSESSRGTTSYASSDGAGGARYVRYPLEAADVYGSAESAQVECVRPNAQLLLGSEERHDHVTIKLAELKLSEVGTLSVSEEYVPPLLSVQPSKPLMQRLSRLSNAVSAKQNSLADRYRGRANALVEFGATDMTTFWYLHTVNSAIPTLTHYASRGDVHPEQLYLALVAFAGQLSTFEQEMDPQNLPRYEHDQLARTFFALFDRLFAMLGSVVSQRYKVIDLEQTQPGLFVGQVSEPNLLRNSQLFLVASGEVPDQSLREDLPRYIKISALDQIAGIVQAAITGVGARVDVSPPSSIPVRPEHIYLRLDQQGGYWQSVLQSNTIAIYQPVLPEKIKLELLAVEA